MSHNEQRREHNEEQRNEYENYVEEERDGKTQTYHHTVQYDVFAEFDNFSNVPAEGVKFL